MTSRVPWPVFVALVATAPVACAGNANPEPGTGTVGTGTVGSNSNVTLNSNTFADLGAATLYNVYVDIFSPAGNLAAVTAQLNRIHSLGFNTLWLMPITPPGQPIGSHPAFDSPYAVHDFIAINPNYGTADDLKTLVSTAHNLGMKVILDQVLNHSSWDNALITQHPEYYLHTDSNPSNPNSIAVAFTFNDVAQFDYKTPGNGLSTYMTSMLQYWLTQYGIDGFRFDTANNPDGNDRMITQAFWQSLRPALQSVNPNVIMLGEEENVALAQAPFAIDYGWNLQSALVQAATSGNAAASLQTVWQAQTSKYPTGMLHMSLLQDWDLGLDTEIYGGLANTRAAAVFNFTLNGIPLLFNGEEVANDVSANNTHEKIDWNAPNAGAMTTFYTALLSLRNAHTALQQGTTTWLNNSVDTAVVTYARASATEHFIIEVNFSGTTQQGTLQAPSGNWVEVPLSGVSHAAPPQVLLQAYDFAIFRSTP